MISLVNVIKEIATTANKIPSQLLLERYSLKRIIPDVAVRTITPIFTIGNTCDFSKIPESKASTKK